MTDTKAILIGLMAQFQKEVVDNMEECIKLGDKSLTSEFFARSAKRLGISESLYEDLDVSFKDENITECFSLLELLCDIQKVRNVTLKLLALKGLLSGKEGHFATARKVEDLCDRINKFHKWDRTTGELWVDDFGDRIRIMWGDENVKFKCKCVRGGYDYEMLNCRLWDVEFTTDETDRKYEKMRPENKLLFRLFGKV